MGSWLSLLPKNFRKSAYSKITPSAGEPGGRVLPTEKASILREKIGYLGVGFPLFTKVSKQTARHMGGTAKVSKFFWGFIPTFSSNTPKDTGGWKIDCLNGYLIILWSYLPSGIGIVSHRGLWASPPSRLFVLEEHGRFSREVFLSLFIDPNRRTVIDLTNYISLIRGFGVTPALPTLI